jgi:hypothetical protein
LSVAIGKCQNFKKKEKKNKSRLKYISMVIKRIASVSGVKFQQKRIRHMLVLKFKIIIGNNNAH